MTPSSTKGGSTEVSSQHSNSIALETLDSIADNRDSLEMVPSIDSLVERPDLFAGMVFRETRSEVIGVVQNRIKKLRKRETLHYPLSNRIHWRVLKVTKDEVLSICVEDPTAAVQRTSSVEINGLLATRSLRITDFEPLASLRLPESSLTDSQKHCRDRNAQLIEPLIELDDGIFDERARWPVIRKICTDKKVAPMKVYRVLRRFFQGGQNKNALAGRWFRRSLNIGRGSRIIGKAEVKAGVKPIQVGRPRHDGHRQFLATEPDIRKIVQGAAKYYHTPQGGNWRRAWELTIAEEYIDLIPNSSVPLEQQLAKYTPDCYPSLAQFRYWANTDKLIVERTKKRLGERRYNLTARKLNGRTEEKANGPGSIFQIDPTPLDIISVHQISRRSIGRIILYLVVDAFSHLIVGYYVHVGNPGYDPASLALLATAEDKVALCRSFGVDMHV